MLMFDVRCLIFDVKCKSRSRCALSTSTIKHPLSDIPRGISLIEILVSIFVLLFGLMGVAAIFPVGNHYITEGEKHDLGSSLAQNSFEELVARGMLRPEAWFYANLPANREQNTTRFIQVLPGEQGIFNVPFSSLPADPHPGHAFVLDPLGAALATSSEADYWPLFRPDGSANTSTVWGGGGILPGETWPVRRLTLAQAGGDPLTTAVAETIFRLRDDLAVTQPDRDDFPSIQNWDIDTGTNTLLRRQYKGDYSWLATIVPTSSDALQALQPAYNSSSYGELRCDVSVVVFRKREVTPSATSERLIEAEIVSDGEIAIYAPNKEEVDAAVDEIRPGNWIAVMGVDQTTGDFIMKWYRLLALDEDTNTFTPTGGGSAQPARYAMIEGPDWPAGSYVDLRVVIMPSVIGVATHQLQMEDTSLWSLE